MNQQSSEIIVFEKKKIKKIYIFFLKIYTRKCFSSHIRPRSIASDISSLIKPLISVFIFNAINACAVNERFNGKFVSTECKSD